MVKRADEFRHVTAKTDKDTGIKKWHCNYCADGSWKFESNCQKAIGTEDGNYKFNTQDMESYSGDYHKTALFSNPTKNQGYYTDTALELICDHVYEELQQFNNKNQQNSPDTPEKTVSDSESQPITPVSGVKRLLNFKPEAGIKADPLKKFTDDDLKLLKIEADGVPASTAQLEGDFSGGEFLTAGRQSTMDWKMLEGLMFVRAYKRARNFIEKSILTLMEAENKVKQNEVIRLN